MPALLDASRLSLRTSDRPTHELAGVDALACEWLETDASGGFASGTAAGIRTRRYHALVLAAAHPPADRFVLVQDVEVWIERAGIRTALSSHVYGTDVIHPDGIAALREFASEPWPTWTWVLGDGARVCAELFVVKGRAATCMRWSIDDTRGARLFVRPRLGPRDFHGTHHANDVLDRGVVEHAGVVRWTPYRDVASIAALANGRYRHDPLWFYDIALLQERARGLDEREDLWSPGEWTFELADGPADLVLGTADAVADHEPGSFAAVRRGELDRRRSLGRHDRARETYMVRRAGAPAIVAGYPWFGEWGRDTFIAMRGLCLATDRLDEATALLEGWIDSVSEGMLPNRFPDAGDRPEYNAVDASLWYGIVVHELLAAWRQCSRPLASARAARLLAAVDAVIDGFVAGTRHGIRVTEDGLVAAGEPGVQLTWMDAKVGDWVVTPRIGKPVEVQALWLALLELASVHRPELEPLHARGRASFVARFVDADRPWLADVVDVDHVPGRVDASLRPNQIYALAGPGRPLVDDARARAILETIERSLLTPMGLRSLAPDDPAYVGHYAGDVRSRDGAYHQGTVWPHLMGPFVEAWLRVHAGEANARERARARFLDPLLQHLGAAGLGHVSEIADGAAPHRPAGAPFQAWGLGELIRIERLLGR